MPLSIRAELSSDTIATSCGITVHIGSPVLSLCRRLVAEGCNPSTPMEVYRGSTLALHVRSIGGAANLRVNTAGTGFTMQQEPTSAPPMSINAPEAARRPRGLTSESSMAA
jgi:hypothetical protein